MIIRDRKQTDRNSMEDLVKWKFVGGIEERIGNLWPILTYSANRSTLNKYSISVSSINGHDSKVSAYANKTSSIPQNICEF